MAKSAAKAKPAGKKAPSLDDLKSQLAGTVSKTKKKPKDNRLTYDNLPEPIQQEVIEFCEKKAIFDLVDAPFEQVKKSVKKTFFPVFVKAWFDGGNLPQNPRVVVKDEDGKEDCRAMFMMTEKFSPQVDQEADDPAENVIETLVACGMDKENAERFVSEELSFNPQQGLYDFGRLSNGHKEGSNWVDASDLEKSAAEKMLMWVLGHETEPLTSEEREVALYNRPNCQVRPGVFQRLRSYANKETDLFAMLDVLNPVYYFSRAECGVNENPVAHVERLSKLVANMLGEKQKKK